MFFFPVGEPEKRNPGAGPPWKCPLLPKEPPIPRFGWVPGGGLKPAPTLPVFADSVGSFAWSLGDAGLWAVGDQAETGPGPGTEPLKWPVVRCLQQGANSARFSGVQTWK